MRPFGCRRRLTDALRVTSAGGRLTVAAEPRDGAVALSVTDTGSGIDPAELPGPFDRFWRAGRDRGGGTGRGLAIARGIVEAHGGRISAGSVV